MMRGVQTQTGRKNNHNWRCESEPCIVYGFSGLPVKPQVEIGRTDEDDPQKARYVEKRWAMIHGQQGGNDELQ